ncbi:intein C-terminal splicing region, partial [Sinosporangium album]
STRKWTSDNQRVHNLTVDDIHTYYVSAQDADVLVHNSGEDCERGLWKITASKAKNVKKHNKFGTFYQDRKGYWWVRDNAGHGGSTWKVYRGTSKGLEWVADADKYGDWMKSKHKGDVGKFISWKDLRG